MDGREGQGRDGRSERRRKGNEPMNVWSEGRKNRGREGRMKGCSDGRKYIKRKAERTGRLVSGWMDRWIDGERDR